MRCWNSRHRVVTVVLSVRCVFLVVVRTTYMPASLICNRYVVGFRNPLAICPSFHPQGTFVGQVSGSKGAGVVDGACENEESTAAKSLGRLKKRLQQQDASPQVKVHEGASPSHPFLQEGLATVVLMAALLCRLGDYIQASFFLHASSALFF